ncbi:MAG: 30S ribosome-binding factor RbfA [Deltaproteobacteria bacterium]|nr:30S ribosome-binding factor RbfA [Deltaproteobacteria bacterium]MBW2372734.1 30S ribosome-binding factor RbfA [Deltaproteobacteria bacterium]
MSRRTDRIGEQVRAEVARILREEVTDPRIGLVTLTRVDVAPDLSNARIFWSTVGDRDEIERGLSSAAGFVRGRLARVLPLRKVPELRFLWDPSLELGDRTLAALRNLSPEDAQEGEETDDGAA